MLAPAHQSTIELLFLHPRAPSRLVTSRQTTHARHNHEANTQHYEEERRQYVTSARDAVSRVLTIPQAPTEMAPALLPPRHCLRAMAQKLSSYAKWFVTLTLDTLALLTTSTDRFLRIGCSQFSQCRRRVPPPPSYSRCRRVESDSSKRSCQHTMPLPLKRVLPARLCSI